MVLTKLRFESEILTTDSLMICSIFLSHLIIFVYSNSDEKLFLNLFKLAKNFVIKVPCCDISIAGFPNVLNSLSKRLSHYLNTFTKYWSWTTWNTFLRLL